MTDAQIFAVTALDYQNCAEKRAGLRPAHIQWLKANADAFLVVGPLRHQPDGPVVGSSLLVRAPDKAALQTLLDADPYAQGGLFETVYISYFQPVIGEWLPT